MVPVGAVPLNVKTSGGTPPVAANVIPTEEPTCRGLKAPVVMTRGAGTMVIEMIADAVLLAGSDAITPSKKDPAVVGVPCNWPPFDSCSPGGIPGAADEPLAAINV